MLPQIQVQARPRTRPRPINPQDTAATTGLAINPNGTYVANPYPTTAAIGGTGGFGAMLPQVNVAGNLPTGTRYQTTGSFLAGNKFNPIVNTQTQTYPAPTVQGLAPLGYGNNPLPQTMPSVATPTSNNFTPGRWSQAAMTNHMQQIAQNPNYLNSLSPETRSALQRMMGIQPATPAGMTTNAAGTGSDEFMNTKFMQKYAEQGTSFVNQLRWDPTAGPKGKYVRIGDLLKQGKLDIHTGRSINRRRNPGRRPITKQQPAQVNDGYTVSNSFVNFNTATG